MHCVVWTITQTLREIDATMEADAFECRRNGSSNADLFDFSSGWGAIVHDVLITASMMMMATTYAIS
jgi:hypothetical protein